MIFEFLFPKSHMADAVCFILVAAVPVEGKYLVKAEAGRDALLLAVKVKWHHIEHDFQRRRWGGSWEAAKSIHGHSIDAAELCFPELGPVAPNHGTVAEHGSYNAEVCPAHEFRFGSPVFLRDCSNLSYKSFSFAYFVLYMRRPVELAVQGNS